MFFCTSLVNRWNSDPLTCKPTLFMGSIIYQHCGLRNQYCFTSKENSISYLSRHFNRSGSVSHKDITNDRIKVLVIVNLKLTSKTFWDKIDTFGYTIRKAWNYIWYSYLSACRWILNVESKSVRLTVLL